MSLRTREQVRRDFDRRGLTIRQWASENGFAENLVTKVLSGQRVGRYGKAHKIAVALGLKEGIAAPPVDGKA